MTRSRRRCRSARLQRWHQGYRLREVTREWGHLQLVLLTNGALCERARASFARSDADRAPILSELCISSVSDSTSEYFELEKLDAAGHVRDLARTLNEERKLQRDRTELWRQAAHDLRGHVGAVVNATTGLSSSAAPASIREKFLLLLQRSTSSLHMMLDDVMDLARLQAGQELLDVKQFDAARLLRELCEELHTQAHERGLYLESGGPDSLIVEGDAVKTRRVAQNLLINALKYTREGGVTVNLGDSKENDPDRWMSPCTTPARFHPTSAPWSCAKAATAASHEIDRKAGVDPSPRHQRISDRHRSPRVNQPR